MIRYSLLCLSWLFTTSLYAQKIHAHNDYAQARPFLTAYEQRVDFIEADVWLLDGRLVVSHDKPRADAPTLDSLYLQPIARLFDQYTDKVSPARDYTFGLMIDVKDSPAEVLPKLITALQAHLTCFNRGPHQRQFSFLLALGRHRRPARR